VAEEPCYTGEHGTLGVGICRAGIRRCLSNGTFGSCSGEVIPSAEACNGEDDDCDGVPDDGFAPLGCGIGACSTTAAACSAGVIGECIPPAPPASTDACNGVDDDCDGAVDEDCATCIRVSPTGDDAAAATSNGATPFRNVQPAIDFADANRNVATRVCVAAGDACGASATFPGPSGTPLTMRNGIDVLGGYRASDFSRCTTSVTSLRPATGHGVYFPASVTAAVLDGFTIERFSAATTSGVTVDGATGVVLSHLTIEDAPAAATVLYGVNVVNGGEGTVFGSTIQAGGSTNLSDSIGIRAVGARVWVTDNCTDLHPIDGCRVVPLSPPNSCPDGPSIRVAPGADAVAGILLEDAPGSRIERTAVCVESGDAAAGISISGDATGVVVRHSSVTVETDDPDAPAAGILLEDCSGASPWIGDNFTIRSCGAAVSVRGDCQAVIDGNREVAGLSWPPTRSAFGVECLDARCTVASNEFVGAREWTTHSANYEHTGIRCRDGCGRVSDNEVVGGSSYRARAYGLKLERSGALVDRNWLRAGTGNGGIGVLLDDSWSRVENNYVSGREYGTCPNISCPLMDGTVAGVYARGVPLGNEPSVHSNRIETGLDGYLYYNHAILVGGANLTPVDPFGVFRNNLLVTTTGVSGFGLFADGGARPRVVEHNAFEVGSFPARAATGTASQPSPSYTSVDPNAFPGAISSGNRWDGVIVDAGTSTGAPPFDYFRNPRDALPDIGPEEAQ